MEHNDVFDESILIKRDEVKNLIKNHKLSQLSSFLDSIWLEIAKDFQEDITLINLTSNEIDDFKVNLLAYYYATLSTITTDWIRGAAEFLICSGIIAESDSEKKSNEEKTFLSFENANTFQNISTHLRPIVLPITSYITLNLKSVCCDVKKRKHRTLPIKIDKLFGRHKIIQELKLSVQTPSDLLQENTPLSHYIYTHYKISREEQSKHDKTSIDSPQSTNSGSSESTKKQSQIRYQQSFANEGRYLTSVLFKAMGSGKSPYTRKAQYGLSNKSLLGIFNLLYTAYISQEIQSDSDGERMLFLLNSELIYHPTLVIKIFEFLKSIFKNQKAHAINIYISSLKFINSIKEIHIPSLQVYLWEEYIRVVNKELEPKNPKTEPKTKETNQVTDKLNKKNYDLNGYISLVNNEIYFMNKFTESIWEALSLWIESCKRNISSYDIYTYSAHKASAKVERDPECLKTFIQMQMEQWIKNNIRDYLHTNPNSFSWSILESPYPPTLRTIYNDYLDFYVLKTFYSSSADAYRILNDFYTYSGEYNSYLNFILDNRR